MKNIDLDSGHPFVKVNHPASGDIVDADVHLAGYGTAFEGAISVRIKDDSGTTLGEGSFQSKGANGIIGEFHGDIQLATMPEYQLGVIEAFESSPKDGSPLNMVRVPIVFAADIVQNQS